MKAKITNTEVANALFNLPCACQSLRRLARITTRIYDRELKGTGIEITQFGLLTALEKTGEVNQKRLSAGFAMDSTSLTRTLCPLIEKGWVAVRPGQDKRERLFTLTRAGRQQIVETQPHCKRAERRLRKEIGERDWQQMQIVVDRATAAATSI
jgi:DNA-binding MarR family transcriptional regulator